MCRSFLQACRVPLPNRWYCNHHTFASRLVMAVVHPLVKGVEEGKFGGSKVPLELPPILDIVRKLHKRKWRNWQTHQT